MTGLHLLRAPHRSARAGHGRPVRRRRVRQTSSCRSVPSPNWGPSPCPPTLRRVRDVADSAARLISRATASASSPDVTISSVRRRMTSAHSGWVRIQKRFRRMASTTMPATSAWATPTCRSVSDTSPAAPLVGLGAGRDGAAGVFGAAGDQRRGHGARTQHAGADGRPPVLELAAHRLHEGDDAGLGHRSTAPRRRCARAPR